MSAAASAIVWNLQTNSYSGPIGSFTNFEYVVVTTGSGNDVIVTGTPPGAGARFDPPRWLVPGDVVEVEVPGIGLLRNQVIDEP